MSDGQPTYTKDWYAAMQRENKLRRAATRKEAEERVHAILDSQGDVARRGLLHHLINLDPVQALEMLILGRLLMPWWGWLLVSLGAVGWSLAVWFVIWLSGVSLWS